ncbi:MAG: hypothetical protein K0R34_837 [Herbinix sp.]|nr:hypothetical protein [Herbinix sp.]
MNRKEIIIGIGALLISISIVIGGYLIGEAIKEVFAVDTASNITSGVMDLPMVAEYMNMSQEEISAIIRLEEKQLTEYGSFSGKMFPYFTIDGKQYFYKEEIDVWLMEVAGSRSIYDMNEGFILR